MRRAKLLNDMTIRTISAAIGKTAETVGRNFAREFGQPHPGFDAVLDAAQADALLVRLSTPSTQRSKEDAAAAAGLLAEFRAGKHQNGHKEYAPVANTGVKMLGSDQLFKAGAEIKNTLDRKTRAPKVRRTATAPIQEPAPTPAKRRAWPTFSMLDAVYYTTIATAVYGLWFTLKEMGLAFAVPYCLIALHALRMAKNPESRKTAQAGVSAVVVLEILTFFVHLTLFNLRAVQAAKLGKLPLEYSYWGTMEAPWWIACVLAGMFSAAGVYAVAVTFSLTSEKHRAAEKEKADADYLRNRNAVLEKALLAQAQEWALVDGWREVRHERADANMKEVYQILNQ